MPPVETYDEKKWFVYLGDHHEGPFSALEIGQRMQLGLVTPESYVWAEGMADWCMMTDVPELRPLYDPSAAAMAPMPALSMEPLGMVQTRGGSAPRVISESQELRLEQAPQEMELEPAPEPTTPRPVAAHAEAPAQVQLTERVSSARAEPDDDGVHLEGSHDADFAHGNTSFSPPAERPRSRVPVKLIAFALIVGGGSLAFSQGYFAKLGALPAVHAGLQAGHEMLEPQLLKLADKFPALGRWISPIPTLEDVSPGEYDSLQAAARAKIAESGPTLAVALSRADILAPSFYVASNLPDGTRIDVYVDGVPDTLLNQVSFAGKVSAVINHHLGKSETLRAVDGKSVARGQYNVYVAEGPEAEQPAATKAVLASAQPANVRLPDWAPKGLKVINTQSYFLGGNKDATYTARLKEFHDRLNVKAATELAELRQFAGTLESQLQRAEADFGQHTRTRNKTQRLAGWNAASSQWTQLETQIESGFAKWTPEALQNEYFYGMIYALVPPAAQAISRLHATQAAWFTGASGDPKSYEIALGQTRAAAQETLTALKAKIEQASRIAPTPNGMPRKEGL